MSSIKQVLQDWSKKFISLILKLSTFLPLTFIFMNNVVWWCLSIEIISTILHQFQFATCQMNMHRRHHLLPPFWADLIELKEIGFGSKVVHSYNSLDFIRQTNKQNCIFFCCSNSSEWNKRHDWLKKRPSLTKERFNLLRNKRGTWHPIQIGLNREKPSPFLKAAQINKMKLKVRVFNNRHSFKLIHFKTNSAVIVQHSGSLPLCRDFYWLNYWHNLDNKRK